MYLSSKILRLCCPVREVMSLDISYFDFGFISFSSTVFSVKSSQVTAVKTNSCIK